MKIREFSHHIINVWIISDGVTGHLIPSYSWLTHITLKKYGTVREITNRSKLLGVLLVAPRSNNENVKKRAR